MDQDTKSKGEKSNKSTKIIVIHLSWILVIAGLIIASLLGLFLCSDKAVVVLSTVSTVTSIILSVVAIIFTLFQAHKSDQYNDEIRAIINDSIKDNMRNGIHIMEALKECQEIPVILRKVIDDNGEDINAVKNEVSKLAEQTENKLNELNLSSMEFWFND